MVKPTILLTDPVSPSVHAAIARAAIVVQASIADTDHWDRQLAGAHGLIVRSFLPPDVFDRAPNMLVAVRHGAGADLIPMDNASRNGVAVANVPGVNGNAVAEFVIARMISLARRLPAIEETMRRKDWNAARALTGQASEIGEKTVGIVGVGSVGRRLAEICHHGFGMRVLGHQRHKANLPPYVLYRDLADLFAESDFIVLACPLTPQTKGLVDAKLISHMRPSAYLINVARGPIVDEDALAKAIEEKRVAGAALDVFVSEPLSGDSAMLAQEDIIVSPHCSGISKESAVKLGMGTLAEILRVFNGEKPINFLNPDIWQETSAKRRRLGFDDLENAAPAARN